MLAYPANSATEAEFARPRIFAEREGRAPASLGFDVWVSARPA